MKTSQLLDRKDSTASGIARSIVQAVLKQNYVEEDIEKAVNQAVFKFGETVKEAARLELKYLKIKKIPPQSTF